MFHQKFEALPSEQHLSGSQVTRAFVGFLCMHRCVWVRATLWLWSPLALRFIHKAGTHLQQGLSGYTIWFWTISTTVVALSASMHQRLTVFKYGVGGFLGKGWHTVRPHHETCLQSHHTGKHGFPELSAHIMAPRVAFHRLMTNRMVHSCPVQCCR